MNLRSAREAKRLSQEKLAQMTGVKAQAISAFENGSRRPWPNAMRALSLALGTDVRTLFPEEVARREQDALDRLKRIGLDALPLAAAGGA